MFLSAFFNLNALLHDDFFEVTTSLISYLFLEL